MLNKFRNRSKKCGSALKSSSSIVLVLPYQHMLSKLGIKGLWDKIVASVLPLGLQIAWAVKPNSMRKLYGLNWPVTGVQCTGIG